MILRSLMTIIGGFVVEKHPDVWETESTFCLFFVFDLI